MSARAADVNRFQASARGHPMTCRNCRGMGECERRDVGVVAGDHHVLVAEDRDRGDVVLVCECCGATQRLSATLRSYVDAMLGEAE